MKIYTVILVIILLLASLILGKVGTLCIFDKAAAADFFEIAISPSWGKIADMLGVFILANMALPLLAVFWIIKKKSRGYTVAYITGFVFFMRGALSFLLFQRSNISDMQLTLTPLIIGALIFLFTFLAKKQQFNLL